MGIPSFGSSVLGLVYFCYPIIRLSSGKDFVAMPFVSLCGIALCTCFIWLLVCLVESPDSHPEKFILFSGCVTSVPCRSIWHSPRKPCTSSPRSHSCRRVWGILSSRFKMIASNAIRVFKCRTIRLRLRAFAICWIIDTNGRHTSEKQYARCRGFHQRKRLDWTTRVEIWD